MPAAVGKSFGKIIDERGFLVVPDAFDHALLERLGEAIARVTAGAGVADRGGVYAFRNLFDHAPGTKAVLEAPRLRDVVTDALGPAAFCVRGFFLDKTPRANWKVPWHQDATIAVKQRGAAVGFGPWSIKGGVQHAMAPPGLLSTMLTVRVHLDNCGQEEGALKVVRGSHLFGRLPADSIGQFANDFELCEVPRGGLFAMRPLLIHASGAATRPGSRRVLQLDFANRELPPPLEWHQAHAI